MTAVIKSIRKYINSIDDDYKRHGDKWYNELASWLYIVVLIILFPLRLPWFSSIQGTFKFFLVVIVGVIVIGALLILLLIGGSYLYFDVLK